MMSIDIKPISSDHLQKNEVSALFAQLSTYEKIIERESIFLLGPKGSGKSMILHYLSMPVQFERYKSNKHEKYDKNFLGVYVNCHKHHFDRTKEKLDKNNLPTEIWKENFTHIFNLTICDVLFRDFSKLKNYPIIQINNNEETVVCKKISQILGYNEIISFESLRNKIRQEINFTYSNIHQKISSTLTVTSFISEIQEIFEDNISQFNEKWLSILLDEYHELTYFQQQIVNEIVSIRSPVFKIATLPPEFSISRIQAGKFLQLISDFEVVEIGTKNISRNSPEFESVKSFLQDIANKRLNQFNLDIVELLSATIPTNSKEPDYSGFENFVLLSSGNARTFLKLLNTTISLWSGSGKNIPYKIQQQAVQSFAQGLMASIDYIPKISPPLFRSIILKIGLLFNNYLEKTKRPYLQIGIKDPQNLSDETFELLSLAIERNYLMEPFKPRESREGFKLESITLLNALLPYFGLPIKTHQVCEMSAHDLENLVDKRSIVDGTSITLENKAKQMKLTETLVPYLDVINELVKYTKNNELGIFVGSGISTELGYPSGHDLAKKIANYFRIEYVGDELPIIAERVLIKRQRGDLIKFIRDELLNSKKKKSSSYSKLVELGFDEVFTTNWDDSIEEEFKKIYPQTEKIVRDGHLAIAGSRKPMIYKLHGDFEHPDMFVITTNDSINIETTRPAIINALKNSLFRKHFLFLGYNMEDLDFKTIFNLINQFQGTVPLTSYAVTLAGSEEKKAILKSKGIVPLTIRGETLIDAIHDGVQKL
ncbi:MAG: SIR2 family protein [Nitrosarchaeum sp.]|nr:SIR2 family protein [Nitrosarchaeum sp.]